MNTKRLRTGLLLLVSFVLLLVLIFNIQLRQASSQSIYVPYPQTRFAVISDLHLFDTSLGTHGNAFQDYLNRDRKLLAESRELVETALDEIADLDAGFVLISGDLTKDGERMNHEIVAKRLAELERSGKQVYVVPGNHDIDNSDAVRFIGDRTEPVSSVTASEFAEIYQSFGFGEALERDSASLSYLVEPVPGLWLLALDSCKWQQHKPGEHPAVGGVISPQTRQWMEGILKSAQASDKRVIVTLHHGIMEHYPGNEDNYPEYLLDNHEEIFELLAVYHVQLVFSGHFHAQDITGKRSESNGATVFDIETGSLVTPPCPYRVIELTQDQQALIKSRFITSIPSHPDDFVTFSHNYLIEGTKQLADDKLIKYRVKKTDRELINPQIADAFATHLKGDEIKPGQISSPESLGLWGRFIFFMRKDLVEGWYTDLPPEDNQLTINLAP